MLCGLLDSLLLYVVYCVVLYIMCGDVGVYGFVLVEVGWVVLLLLKW